ncbi:MAG: ComF family protein [Pseudomonadota bacterium]
MTTDTLLNLILPDHCVLCDQLLLPRPDHLICDFCRLDLPHNRHSCPACALPLAPQEVHCPGCPTHPECLSLAALRHEHTARFLVHRFKFQHSLRAGQVLAQTMAEHAQQIYGSATTLPEALLPVPLRPWSEFRRGYNQARWLAVYLSRALHIPVIDILQRTTATPPQRQLSKAARLRLPVNTFTVQRPLQEKHVAVVDDVLTTGRTTNVIRTLLKTAGAARVDVWCATRALP